MSVKTERLLINSSTGCGMRCLNDTGKRRALYIYSQHPTESCGCPMMSKRKKKFCLHQVKAIRRNPNGLYAAGYLQARENAVDNVLAVTARARSSGQAQCVGRRQG